MHAKTEPKSKKGKTVIQETYENSYLVKKIRRRQSGYQWTHYQRNTIDNLKATSLTGTGLGEESETKT